MGLRVLWICAVQTECFVNQIEDFGIFSVFSLNHPKDSVRQRFSRTEMTFGLSMQCPYFRWTWVREVMVRSNLVPMCALCDPVDGSGCVSARTRIDGIREDGSDGGLWIRYISKGTWRGRPRHQATQQYNTT